ncbi:hypothetical protein R4P64_31360 [Rhodococcus sp. IEGM 1366]|uniref:hypothetical protein n=1 Tax=Rhodococcus sp. IEGM 1366 TaxID=3082223 RepID=UPI002953640B|nr:hypothetical protein [Rhodococcus sp. IEGM 1366]MDV8071018.1 hypothetical protein [Rhodococcus sp. IEGM 1366]
MGNQLPAGGRPEYTRMTGVSPHADTVGWRVLRLLRERGVGAVYGDSQSGMPVTTEAPRELARLLAAAHRRVHRRPAAAWSDGVLFLGAAAAAEPADIGLVAGDVTGLQDVLSLAVNKAETGRSVSVRLDLDLAEPAGSWQLPRPPGPAAEFDVTSTIDRLESATSPLVLAGPGVVDAGAVPGLHALAAAGRLGVLNTWGAKGIFPWSSPHHWATIGLQQDDFHLAGLAAADLIVATGLDECESPARRWQLADHITVAPDLLGELAISYRSDADFKPMPALRVSLASATQRGWSVDSGPLPPSKVTSTYAAWIAGRAGLVVAEPGTAGFWIARTVGTTILDTVIVPGEPVPEGFAIACALVARLAEPGRPVLAVLDRVPMHADVALLELADRLRVAVPVEAWVEDGDALDYTVHVERVCAAMHSSASSVMTLATDSRQLSEMIDIAGPVVAWRP